jgi:uncharacterized coiled-coil DUF342 family protein
MAKKKAEKEIVDGISNISTKFDQYREKHWELSQKITCLAAKKKELEDERKEIEKAMKVAALADKALWSQLEFAF